MPDVTDPDGASPAAHTAMGRLVLAMLQGRPEQIQDLTDEQPPELLTSGVIVVPLLREILRRRFTSQRYITDIREYCADAYTRGVLGPDRTAARFTEAVLRSVLGEADIAAGIPSQEAGDLAMRVLLDLGPTLQLSDLDLEELVAAAERSSELGWRN